MCLEATVTGNLFGAPQAAQVRSLSTGGVELVVPGGALASADIAVAFGREAGEKIRAARVVWRQMDRFGVEFGEGSRPCDDSRPGPLSRLLQVLRQVLVVLWV